MIDHVSVGVSDLERSARFYEAALAPLGLARLVVRPATIGFGKNYPESGSIFAPTWRRYRRGVASTSAFEPNRPAMVDAFHAAALQAGGRSDGAPGLRHA